MRWVATILAGSLLGLLAAMPSVAQSARHGLSAGDALAQSPRQRARTKLRVRPIYPYRRYHSVYPVPYPIEYPGPNAKRDCVARYVEEHRPSGTVVVPRMNCRWVPG
jgi:hypothetical protein